MAEIILGALCLITGVVCAFIALVVLAANAIGGATNASAVNTRPAFWLGLLAVAGIGGGVFLVL